MKELKFNANEGIIVYKDNEGWKFYCNINEFKAMKKVQFSGECQYPELQDITLDNIPELTVEEYKELQES